MRIRQRFHLPGAAFVLAAIVGLVVLGVAIWARTQLPPTGPSTAGPGVVQPKPPDATQVDV